MHTDIRMSTTITSDGVTAIVRPLGSTEEFAKLFTSPRAETASLVSATYLEAAFNVDITNLSLFDTERQTNH